VVVAVVVAVRLVLLGRARPAVRETRALVEPEEVVLTEEVMAVRRLPVLVGLVEQGPTEEEQVAGAATNLPH
jgi:hypothetical protein